VVFGEWLRNILGIRALVRHDMSQVDTRLARVEKEQRDVDVRLRLLEKQADIRGYREDD
jgi:hypothetical protein